MTQDDRRAFEELFGCPGWELLLKDIKDQVERLQEHGLDCANWDAVVYNRGVRDALRVLLNYERPLDVVSEDEPDADPV